MVVVLGIEQGVRIDRSFNSAYSVRRLLVAVGIRL